MAVYRDNSGMSRGTNWTLAVLIGVLAVVAALWIFMPAPTGTDGTAVTPSPTITRDVPPPTTPAPSPPTPQ